MPELGPAEVQIWATSTGGGHRRVAEALRLALLAMAPPGLRVAIDDPLQLGALPHAQLLLRGYGPVVRTSPTLWGKLFDAFSLPPARIALERFLLSGVGPAMRQATMARHPGVVVNCHPLLGPGAALAAGRISPPAQLVTLITDLTVVHPGWLSPRTARFLTPSAVATSWCVDQGVSGASVVEVGLPVDPRLRHGSPPERPARRARLGVDPDLICVLVGGGGEGAGRLLPLVTAVGLSGLPVQLVVLCGRNRRLLRAVRRLRLGLPLRALPYLQDPSPWLLASDIYVGKAGPSALAEAAAAGLAIIVTDALPGQETSNRELLVNAGAALSVASPAELVSALTTLAAGSTDALAKMQSRAREWSRPDAADRAAAEILALMPPLSPH